MLRILPGLAALLPSLPVMLVWAAGITLAGARFREHRRSSMLLGLGLLGLLLQRLLVAPMMATLPMWLVESGWSTSQVSGLFLAVGVSESLASAVWYSLLIAAVVLPDPPTAAP